MEIIIKIKIESELAFILQNAIDKMQYLRGGGIEQTLRDHNGNRVGQIETEGLRNEGGIKK